MSPRTVFQSTVMSLPVSPLLLLRGLKRTSPTVPSATNRWRHPRPRLSTSPLGERTGAQG